MRPSIHSVKQQNRAQKGEDLDAEGSIEETDKQILVRDHNSELNSSSIDGNGRNMNRRRRAAAFHARHQSHMAAVHSNSVGPAIGSATPQIGNFITPRRLIKDNSVASLQVTESNY